MINWTEKSFERHLQLQAELDWLKDEHPDKTALIALAEQTIRTINQASANVRTQINSDNSYKTLYPNQQ